MIYSGNINNYSFIMEESDTIEIWSNLEDDFPESYIHVEDGEIDSERKFHMEIMSWWTKNKN